MMFYKGLNILIFYALLGAAVSTGFSSLEYSTQILTLIFIGKFIQFYYMLPICFNVLIQYRLKGINGIDIKSVCKILLAMLIGSIYKAIITNFE